MKLSTAVLVIVAGLRAQTSPLAVSVPRVIRFSATLPGGAQTGATGVMFSIFRDQFGGAPLWSEVQNVRGDQSGAYTALLGATRNEGLPVDLFNTKEPRWLEVEINGVKEPRQLLGSVPYAMVAADAQTLGGLPPSAYLRVDTPAAPAAVKSNPLALSDGIRANLTSGNAGYLAVFTNGTDLGNSALYQGGNTISIGGTASLGAMTLIGNAPSGDTAGMALYNSGGGGGASVSLDMYNTYANGGIPQAKIKALDDGAFSDHLTFWTKIPGAASLPLYERVRITSSGNVGIGTDTPTATLEVSGSMQISGTGNGIIFPDGTKLTSAIPGGAKSLSFSLGTNALASNTGVFNTAVGTSALQYNSTGGSNVGIGNNALQNNTTGDQNVAIGVNALLHSNGSFNTAIGNQSLSNNSGSYNTAVGANSGLAITSGSYNIAIGNQGTSTDDHVIRIGDVQVQAFIAGILNANISGAPVLVNSAGQLGVAASSRRFKEDIQDMGGASSGIMRLRPVTYRYKQPYADGSKPLDYGLIAEEVAEVYPDLVAHSQDGQIQTVMYQKLTPLLLNEVQQLHKQAAAQTSQLQALAEQGDQQQAELNAIKARLARLEELLQPTTRGH